MINLYLIRHAESEGNLNHHLIGGQSNHFRLTERGVRQCDLLGERLQRENWHFDRVYSSTAVRARETARIVCGYVGFPEADIQLTDNILELSQGDWVGYVRKEIYTPEVVAQVRANSYDFKAPGGESQREVEARMAAWFREITAEFDGSENLNIACFSHGFALKTLLRHILEASPAFTYRIMLHNTSVTGLQLVHGDWHLERINDHAHLAGTEFVAHY
ncbi:MAG: histidine phosphatase family protein [Bacteroidetes bacterium]|nr:MAG: histidine phosphatase family protein [Bacteroidota bacterium]